MVGKKRRLHMQTSAARIGVGGAGLSLHGVRRGGVHGDGNMQYPDIRSPRSKLFSLMFVLEH